MRVGDHIYRPVLPVFDFLPALGHHRPFLQPRHPLPRRAVPVRRNNRRRPTSHTLQPADWLPRRVTPAKQKKRANVNEVTPVRPVHLEKDGALALCVVLARGRILEVLVLSSEVRTKPERATEQKRRDAHHTAKLKIVHPSER